MLSISDVLLAGRGVLSHQQYTVEVHRRRFASDHQMSWKRRPASQRNHRPKPRQKPRGGECLLRRALAGRALSTWFDTARALRDQLLSRAAGLVFNKRCYQV